MQQVTVEFENVLTKQSVEDWADAREFIAKDMISLHFEEKFEFETGKHELI